MRADWTASGACTSGSTAPPRGATRRASGGAATTSTTPREDDPLFPESLEAIRELRAFVTLVCQLGDQQREGFGVTRDPQWSSVHRIETHIANQLGGSFLALRLVPAVHEAGFRGVASPFENVKQHLARQDRKSTRLNSSHSQISYAVFCLKKKNTSRIPPRTDH